MELTKEKLKEIRKELGFTQKEMANQMGFSHYRRIQEKEYGEVSITPRDEVIIKALLQKKKQTTKKRTER